MVLVLVSALIVFGLSFLMVFAIIRFEGYHVRFSADHDLEGIQKFHTIPVPRVGGIPIFLTFLCFAVWYGIRTDADWPFVLLLCSLPCFIAGLLEDFTKRISPTVRLLASMLAAYLAIFFLGFELRSTGFSWMDGVFNVPILLWTLITVPIVGGIVNAINIIDGYHGLASMVCMLIIAAYAYMGWLFTDASLLWTSLALVFITAGFLVWNFPFGKIFLGDGGAYFLGFMVAQLGLYLHVKYHVSPWFVLMLLAYPITEMLVSIWRRRVVRGKSVSRPDNLHLHTLVYRRLVRPDDPARNAKTSPYLWGLQLLAVLMALVFWNNELALKCCFVLFFWIYIKVYKSIVHFQSQWIRRIFVSSSRE